MDEGLLSARVDPRAQRSYPIRLVAGLAVAAGVIHSVALVQHFGESVLYGAFFAIVAACQLAWGAWVYRRPDKPRTLAAAAIANLAIAAIWALSRTTGLPLGPEAGQPEAPGVLDLLATFDELAIAAGVIAILQPAGRLGTRLAGLTNDQQTRIGIALITATLFAILLGSHAH